MSVFDSECRIFGDSAILKDRIMILGDLDYDLSQTIDMDEDSLNQRLGTVADYNSIVV